MAMTKNQWLRNAGGVLDGPYCEVIELTPELRQKFLAAVATGASMHAAASLIHVPYLVIGRTLATDASFAADLDTARELRKMAAEELLLEQATVGIDEQLTHQGRPTYTYDEWYDEDEYDDAGNVVGRVRKPVESSKRMLTVKKLVTSNPSLLAYLKAHDRAKWGDKQEVTHRDDNELPTRVHNATDRDKLRAALIKRAQARAAQPTDGEDLL